MKKVLMVVGTIIAVLTMGLQSWAGNAGGTFQVSRNETTVRINAGERPVFEYRYADVPFKPYCSQIYSPDGVAVLRDNVIDHKHHHGLMFALSADGVDFWSELPANGKQVQSRILTTPDGLAQDLNWEAPGGKIMLSEVRTITVHSGPETLLTWRSGLFAPKGSKSVKLSGSHYFGLGARFVTDMDKVGAFVNSAGATGTVVRGTEKMITAKWCAYTAASGGRQVTFAMFDHPSNPRHPAQMFTMLDPFSYLSATLGLHKEPLLIEEGKRLDLRYGVALWDGNPGADRIEETYGRWLKECYTAETLK